METISYPIHQAIARPVTFKGFQAQYILLAAGAVMSDLFLFIILYCCKISPGLCIPIAVFLGASALYSIRRLSRKYGVNGLLKRRILRKMPDYIRCNSRRPFIQLNKKLCHTI